MSEMFLNYKNPMAKVGPNNQHRYLPPEKEFFDEIYLGANIEHVFTVPHAFSEIEDLTVQYYQGTELKLTKTLEDMRIDQYRRDDQLYCKMRYEISAEESLEFNAYNTEVYVQLKAVLTDGEIEYSPEYKILIVDSNMKEVL